MGFSAIARGTPDHWVACAVQHDIGFGLKPGGELEVKITLCDEICNSGQRVKFDAAALDPAFHDHHKRRIHGLQSYISVPIRHRGEFFGTLCSIDPNPAHVNTPATIGTFELFADLIGRHLDLENELAASAEALMVARQAEELLDQFIAVLGHDLRNPLTAVDAGLLLASKIPLNERATAMVDMMQGSVALHGRPDR